MTIDEKATLKRLKQEFPNMLMITLYNVIRCWKDNRDASINIKRHSAIHWINCGLAVLDNSKKLAVLDNSKKQDKEYISVKLSDAVKSCFVKTTDLRKVAERIVALFEGPTHDFMEDINDVIDELKFELELKYTAHNSDVDKIVQRFLQWQLPDDFQPDGGISFDKNTLNKPSGTNLLSFNQAKAMVEFILETKGN